jgi:hypothetical protein
MAENYRISPRIVRCFDSARYVDWDEKILCVRSDDALFHVPFANSAPKVGPSGPEDKSPDGAIARPIRRDRAAKY